MRVGKQLYFEEMDIEKWETFCLNNFKTKRVLSKILTEAMEQYVENY